MDLPDLPIDGQQLQALLDARVAQLALVLLLVFVLVIAPVMIIMLRNARNSEKERNKILEEAYKAAATDRQQAALDRRAANAMTERMVKFAEATLNRESDLSTAVDKIADINERLPELYQKSNEDYQKRVLTNHEKIILGINTIDELPKAIDEAAHNTQKNSNDNTLKIINEVKAVKTTADDIQQKVTAQINFGQVLDRMVEDAHSLVLIADRFATADSIVSEFRKAFTDRVVSLEDNVKALDVAVKELKSNTVRPTLDTVAAALAKRDSKPIPDMPTTGPSPDAVTTVTIDTTTVTPPFAIGDDTVKG